MHIRVTFGNLYCKTASNGPAGVLFSVYYMGTYNLLCIYIPSRTTLNCRDLPKAGGRSRIHWLLWQHFCQSVHILCMCSLFFQFLYSRKIFNCSASTSIYEHILYILLLTDSCKFSTSKIPCSNQSLGVP